MFVKHGDNQKILTVLKPEEVDELAKEKTKEFDNLKKELETKNGGLNVN
jgi:hypothetical protein